jgi:sigma-B regulation protein RsbU (phosphoserine phosphatase)
MWWPMWWHSRGFRSTLISVSGPLVRRLRLPAVGTSPAAARAVVAALLAEAELESLRDEALLLTSELVTNGVIHAGSPIELELVADGEGLQVTVTDFAVPPAALMVTEITAANRDDGEGGRGLLLVSRLASRWGTSHEPGGRAVWFRIDHPGKPDDDTAPSDSGATPTDADHDARPSGPHHDGWPSWPGPAGHGPVPDIRTMIDAVVGPAGTEARAGGAGLRDLLDRLGRGLSAATATIIVDRADGIGPQVLARYTSAQPAAGDGRTVRVPLALSRPWTGQLTLTGARGHYAHPVAVLTAGQFALLLENRRLEEAHDERRGWLLFLAEAGELLAQSMNVELTAALVPRLVVPRLGQWCAVHLANEYGELSLTALTHAHEGAIAHLTAHLNQAALERVVDGKGFAPLGPPTDGMSFPLRFRGERLGVLTVGRPADRPHTPEELAIIDDLGRRAGVAIDNARVHDNRGRIATALQASLLPPTLPSIQGLEVAAAYVPAGDGLDVGGDFYDIMPLPGQGWMLVVGDVSGKGVGAAAVTGLVREVLHTLSLDHHEPEHTLSRLNATLVERGGGYFCTLALAFLSEVAPGRFELSLHLAGHDRPVLLRADGTTTFAGEGGTALGLLDVISTPRTTIQLNHGDALVFYTDGVTERRKGRTLYGHRRLRNEMSNLAGSPAAVLASQLRSSVLAFSPSSPRDDIAIVALRAL